MLYELDPAANTPLSQSPIIQYHPPVPQPDATAPMTDSDATPALKQAAQNPWYLLATLYGEPKWGDKELKDKSRVAWNRYYASIWTDEQRAALKEQVDAAELVPFTDAELIEIRGLFHDRAKDVRAAMPGADQRIDFSECRFDQPVDFDKYVFGSVDFRSATFSRLTDFGHATFLRAPDFSSATFSGDAYFSSASFSMGTCFSSATFSENAYFSSASFIGNADFRSTYFSGYADFSSAIFSGDPILGGLADFRGATFPWYADFRSATFSENADFSSATFPRDASFSTATFSSNASFSSATFSGSAHFHSATFHRAAIFTNSELKAPTDFEDSQFLGEPPRFHGGKLHEDTVWRGVKWPAAPADRYEAGWFTDAYERLKLEMDRLKKHEDELMFFAEEMKCRRVAAGWFKGLPIAAYGWFCDYGRSYVKPLVWMVAVFNAGVPALWLLQPDLGWGKAVGLSAVNCLAGLGIRKDLMGKVLDDLGPGALIVSGVQTVAGLILLFLIGLGLRNRFRMK